MKTNRKNKKTLSDKKILIEKDVVLSVNDSLVSTDKPLTTDMFGYLADDIIDTRDEIFNHYDKIAERVVLYFGVDEKNKKDILKLFSEEKKYMDKNIFGKLKIDDGKGSYSNL